MPTLLWFRRDRAWRLPRADRGPRCRAAGGVAPL